jgi:ribosome-associated translation inhibitor RaiA
MRIQVNTDSSIQGDESLEAFVIEAVEKSIGRFKEDVTRVEVHLSDVNKDKGGTDDKRCMMEARIEGLSPTAVTHNAGTVREAINGATEKLKRSLTTTLEKRKSHR